MQNISLLLWLQDRKRMREEMDEWRWGIEGKTKKSEDKQEENKEKKNKKSVEENKGIHRQEMWRPCVDLKE